VNGHMGRWDACSMDHSCDPTAPLVAVVEGMVAGSRNLYRDRGQLARPALVRPRPG